MHAFSRPFGTCAIVKTPYTTLKGWAILKLSLRDKSEILMALPGTGAYLITAIYGVRRQSGAATALWLTRLDPSIRKRCPPKAFGVATALHIYGQERFGRTA